MSFKCQECGVPQPSNVSPIRIVTRVRRRTYEHRHINATHGEEVVRELNMCAPCAVPWLAGIQQ